MNDQDLNSAAKRRRGSPDDSTKAKRKPSSSHFRSEEAGGVNELLSSEESSLLAGAKDANVQVSLPAPSSEQTSTSPKVCAFHYAVICTLIFL